MVNVEEMVRFARSPQLQRHYDNIARGLCTSCLKPNESHRKWLCDECAEAQKVYQGGRREYNREYMRKWRAKQRARKTG